MVQAGRGAVFEEDTLDGEVVKEIVSTGIASRGILDPEVKTGAATAGLPFGPSLAAAPIGPPPSRLETALDWLSRRRPLLLVVLAALVVLSAYLAFQSQSPDELTASASNQPTRLREQASESSQDDETTEADQSDEGDGPLTAELGDGDSRSSGPSEPATSQLDSSTTATNVPRTTAAPTTRATVATTGDTAASTTAVDSSEAPATPVPTTETPTTEAPTTEAPTTEAPTTPPTTAKPTTTAAPTTTTTVPLPIPGPNEIANGGFEKTSVRPGDYALVPAVGWSSEDGRLEIWGTGHNGISAIGGQHFAELNSVGPVMISQRVPVVPGATYTWSFSHRGRNNRDTVEVLINGQVVATKSTRAGRWNEYSGEVVVPNGQETMEFGLRPLDSGSSGNLVDRVKFRRTQNP